MSFQLYKDHHTLRSSDRPLPNEDYVTWRNRVPAPRLQSNDVAGKLNTCLLRTTDQLRDIATQAKEADEEFEDAKRTWAERESKLLEEATKRQKEEHRLTIRLSQLEGLAQELETLKQAELVTQSRLKTTQEEFDELRRQHETCVEKKSAEVDPLLHELAARGVQISELQRLVKIQELAVDQTGKDLLKCEAERATLQSDKENLEREHSLCKPALDEALQNQNQGLATIASLQQKNQKQLEEATQQKLQLNLLRRDFSTATHQIEVLVDERDKLSNLLDREQDKVRGLEERLEDEGIDLEICQRNCQELKQEMNQLRQKLPQHTATADTTAAPHDPTDTVTMSALYDSFLSSLSPEARSEHDRRWSTRPTDLQGLWERSDEIRTWIQSNDPGNPTPLLDRHPQDLALALRKPITQTWAISIAEVLAIKTEVMPAPVGTMVTEDRGPPCNHVLSLATALGMPALQDWNALLSQVQILLQLRDARHAPVPAATTGTEPSRLPFKAEDIPKFRSIREYNDTYQPQLSFFCRTYTVPTSLLQEALYLIVSRWEKGTLLDYAREGEVSTLVRADWRETWQALIAWMDSRFLTADFYTKALERWDSPRSHLKQSDYDSGAAFFLAMEGFVNAFRRHCRVKSVPEPTELEITRKIIPALPQEVLNVMRLRHQDIDTVPVETYRTEIELAWTTVTIKRPHAKSAGVKRSWDETLTQPEWEKEAAAYAARTQNICGLRQLTAKEEYVGSVTNNPYLSPERREKARQRNKLCRQNNICFRCRHPEKEHLKDGTFSEVRPFQDGPSARFAGIQPEENMVETKEPLPENEENNLQEADEFLSQLGKQHILEYPLPKCLLTRDPSISNPRLIEGFVKTPNRKGGESVDALVDTGAQVDLVAIDLIDKLGITPSPLCEPVQLGSIKESNAMKLTHMAKLKFKLGLMRYEWTFFVAPLQDSPQIILGEPWIQEYCPGILSLIKSIGLQETNVPWGGDKMQPKRPRVNFVASTTYCVGTCESNACPECRQQRLEKVVEAMERQDQLVKNYKTAMTLRAALSNAIEQAEEEGLDEEHESMEEGIIIEISPKQTQASVRRAAIDGDPGTRGLTGNKEGWELTIPESLRDFNASVFSDSVIRMKAPSRPGFECVLKLKDGAELKAHHPYQLSLEQMKVLRALLDNEREAGIIVPSKSPYASPGFFVTDPGSKQQRWVIDFRAVNKATIRDEYPLPRINHIMEAVAGAKVISTMDVSKAFAMIPMEKNSQQLTAFTTPLGLFEYTSMPMGLANAPSVWQRFADSLFNGLDGVFVYLDDIVIISDTHDEHIRQCRRVLEILRENGLHAKPHKCKWFQKEVEFLGYTLVAGEGIKMTPSKLEGIQQLEEPRNRKELQEVLGVMGFYAQFILHYADHTAVMTDLLKKDVPWNWNPAVHGEAWRKLKEEFTRDVFLRKFDPGKPIILSTDASDVAWAIVLEQLDENGVARPFRIDSGKFKDAEKNWDVGSKELWPIVVAFTKYERWLAQPEHPVQVYSDHRNLAGFMLGQKDLKIHAGRAGRWWQILSGCNFEIQYRPGKENVLADFISRYQFEESADLGNFTLLPAHRFSQPALADIAQMFRSHKDTVNIRDRLERSFALRPKEHEKFLLELISAENPQIVYENYQLTPNDKKNSQHHISPSEDLQTTDLAREKLNDSPDPVQESSEAGVKMAAPQRASFGDMYKSRHPEAELIRVPPHLIRRAGDTRGLGYGDMDLDD